MDSKNDLSTTNQLQQRSQQYLGPPEYVEQQFPQQAPYTLSNNEGQYHASYYGQYPPLPNGGGGGGGYPPPMPTGVFGPAGYPPGPPQQFMQGGYPPPPPIMHQPMGNPFAVTDGFYVDSEIPYVNPGGDPNLALNYLKTITQLEVRQKIELLELFTNFETPNKYSILDGTNRQPVLFACEVSDCCARQCCGPERPLEIRIVDVYQTEVIHLNRPLRCQSFCFPCCLQVLEVSSPPGNVVSTIEQCWSLWPKFHVNDSVGNTILRIEGPFFTCSCCCKDVRFEILAHEDDSVIGEIKKKWSGFTNEYFTKADNFEVTFPRDLDVYFKAALLGAIFLIDMMYYEQSQNNNSHDSY